MISVVSRFVLPVFLACQGAQTAGAQSLKVSCKLDSLVDLPALWKRSAASFEKEFPGDPSPHFTSVDYEGTTYLRFSKSPYRDVINRMELFGSVTPNSAVVALNKSGVQRLEVLLYEGEDLEEAKKVLIAANAALKASWGEDYKPWSNHHDPSAARQSMGKKTGRGGEGLLPPRRAVDGVLEATGGIDAKGIRWEMASGVALLDHAKWGSGLHEVRLRAVPPGQQVIDLVARYHQEVRSGLLSCDLSPLLKLPDLWRMTPDDLEEAFPPPTGRDRDNDYFRWLTEDRSRALFVRRAFSNLHIALDLFEERLPAEEIIIDFKAGKVSEVRISVWNQGDSGELSQPEFEALFKTCGRRLGEALGTKPSPRPKDTKTGIEVKGFRWINKAKGVAYLEHNPEARTRRLPQPEYLRIRLLPRPVEQTSMRRIQLAGMLRRDGDGSVWIPGVPMVDQGQKGYCVVASCQRVFEYYRIPIDQHQIAPLFGTEAEKGTSTRNMEKSLEKIAGKFHTEFTRVWFKGNREVKFTDAIRSNIDDGVPLMWCKEVEKGGSHMSLIIGYNPKDSTLIFTDSWGRGHERKSISLADAEAQSFLLHRFEPTL